MKHDLLKFARLDRGILPEERFEAMATQSGAIAISDCTIARLVEPIPTVGEEKMKLAGGYSRGIRAPVRVVFAGIRWYSQVFAGKCARCR